jgi:hypothetical protein
VNVNHVWIGASRVGLAGRRLRAAALCVIALGAAPSVAGAQPVSSSGSPEVSGPASWPTRPTVVFGDVGRLEIGARVQSRFVASDDRAIGIGPADDRFGFERARMGITAQFFGRLDIQAERQINDKRPWRDLFADIEVSRQLHVRAGHFKVPFSREQMTSMYELDFTHRSAIVDDLVPLRGTGVMLHGRLADRAVRYQTGVFEDSRQPRFAAGGPRLLSSRVVVAPLKKGDHRGAETVALSVSWLRRQVREGRSGPRGHLVTGETFYEPVYAKGTRTLVGWGAVWHVPALTIASELIRSTDTRVGQSLTGGDLSDFVTRGGYASAAWHLIHGRGRRRGPSPFRELDLTGRYDWVQFGSAGAADAPSRDPRADHVAPLAKRTLTLGVSWWLNRWMAVHSNAIREQVADAAQLYPIAAGSRWTAVIRSQVVM